jgi:peroxidase
MREHNRIASALSLLNPTWSDETLYYETRRILIAVYQHIIYNEWIPATIGKAVADLRVQPINRYYTGYDSSVNFEIFLLD